MDASPLLNIDEIFFCLQFNWFDIVLLFPDYNVIQMSISTFHVCENGFVSRQRSIREKITLCERGDFIFFFRNSNYHHRLKLFLFIWNHYLPAKSSTKGHQTKKRRKTTMGIATKAMHLRTASKP